MSPFLRSLCLFACFAVSTNACAQLEEQRSTGGGKCERSVYNCADTPNPLPPADTVWLEEMTWMDVRDAMASGKTTIIIPGGGVEPNGPWLALGKHNYVLQATCDAIARDLGNALCAPVNAFVPEGDPETRSGHMDTVGTISVRDETYEAIMTDVAVSMRAHGFKNIVLLSDNGGSSQSILQSIAEQLNAAWGGAPRVHYIPEYYASWNDADQVLLDAGVTKKGVRDGVHDDPSSTFLMMLTDPQTVRWQARVDADLATIDGVSISDRETARKWGLALLKKRADLTVAAIRKSVEGQ